MIIEWHPSTNFISSLQDETACDDINDTDNEGNRSRVEFSGYSNNPQQFIIAELNALSINLGLPVKIYQPYMEV